MDLIPRCMNNLKLNHLEVAKLIAQGLPTKQIAVQLNRTTKSIETSRSLCLAYYHCSNATQLAHRLLSLNLIQNIYQNEPFTSD